DWLAPDAVSELAERPDAESHSDDYRRSPHGRFGQAEAEALGEIAGHPNHDSVIAEVLEGTQDGDSNRYPAYLSILHQQMKRVLLSGGMLLDENLRLVERSTDDEGHNGGQKADQEHAPPTDHWEQHRGNERGQQNSRLPSQCHIGGHSGALARWPS